MGDQHADNVADESEMGRDEEANGVNGAMNEEFERTTESEENADENAAAENAEDASVNA